MIRLAFAFLLSLCVSAQAQLSGGVGGFPGPGTAHSTGGGGYTGPCEVSGVNCVAFYAAEACATNAYSGNTVDIVDAATGNTTGTRLQCSSGVVSALVSGSACTFVTGNACSSLATTCASSCVFKTIYNQSGTATFPDLIDPATLTARLTITTGALNSKACFAGNGSRFATNNIASLPSLAQPFTMAAVTIRTANFTTQSNIVGDGNTVSMSFRPSANTVGSLGGTVTQTATDNVYHSIMEVVGVGATSFMVADGTAGSTGTLTATFGTNALNLGAYNNTPSNPIQGNICELLIANTALNSTQYGALNTNTRAANRWGNSF